eukprot:CAMPEP_0115072808 /NCGR_PEP_ID=MMETSP0227-20121206/14437_1 /TAXON_ID=89957 /ORGANISM="Polarella glacialis, Strain CCMP 1383" /LENGTH=47 /DNA_ID= /DNA_START= /DNA_END= /DNA_ORIENTATION=
MGSAYREAIRARMASHEPKLQQILAHTDGQRAYEELRATQQREVPEL